MYAIQLSDRTISDMNKSKTQFSLRAIAMLTAASAVWYGSSLMIMAYAG